MSVYTYTEARQNLATLLDKALREGEVLIKRRDGQMFAVRRQTRRDSPLSVDGIDLKVTASQIVAFIQERRRAFDAHP